jgi:rubrerythrin
MDFRESKTFNNLQHALEGELKASTKYSIYGSKAREDGFEQIGDIFDETSHNEKEHAEIWMKIMNNGEIPDTLDNLKDAYSGETYEWTKMYREYAQEAAVEGYQDIADLFEGVAGIERHHDFRFRELAKNIETGEVFCKKNEHLWICMNCGNIIRGKCAPEVCPVCGFPQAYYKLLDDNF